MEVVETEEGEEAPAAAEAPAGEPAGEPATAGGLRFAEDLQPALEDEGPKRAKKGKGKKEPEEAGAVKGRKTAKKSRRLATAVEEEEDIDFEMGLEEYAWSDEPKDDDE